jgi:hypothetical protein
MKGRIIAAAILYEGNVYSIEAPGRHHDICRWMVDVLGMSTESTREQGFVTEEGHYASRKIAKIIAERAGQLNVVRPKTSPDHLLFSEDLW